MNKCVFLDRDGVLNRERGTYTYTIADFEIPTGVIEALQELKQAGYLLVVITNQGGIAKGLYTKEDVKACHQYLQQQCGYLLDDLFYSPYHPQYSESLSRKPESFMLEKAVAKYVIDRERSWMIGDSARDIEAAKKIQVNTVQVIAENKPISALADFTAKDLYAAVRLILSQNQTV
ncbi:D-glycero-alpha-D-manno-heptose-1,7-bisphosphate 7-phosphatase [Microscilla marina]|uniref:D,D-heptose 1,7-bisphosphate phosphatase n=1 Tax=Microscilla marina ATCC 23134 TaxID=313606 RepID=A1ZZD7_MICM2|nr:HAD family hydrolase [Microscilla marina]EAY24236.1 D,D-heptose 1,7-bisphosphate phosphatase [Microscilla marina ATCC 23134]